MELQNKATSLWRNFFNVKIEQIRTFQMTENLQLIRGMQNA